MQKQKDIISNMIIILVLLSWALFMGYGLWEGIGHDIIPWTRTNFSDYPAYIEFLNKYQCFGGVLFESDCPETSEINYYWRQSLPLKAAAYSAVLPESQYKEFQDRRLASYEQRENEAERIVYTLSGGERCYIENPGWCEEEMIRPTRLQFLENVLINPEQKQEYYYLVVSCIDTSGGECYNGVVLNDITGECVEFSVELSNVNHAIYEMVSVHFQ